jgi:hypothetical protein
VILTLPPLLRSILEHAQNPSLLNQGLVLQSDFNHDYAVEILPAFIEYVTSESKRIGVDCSHTGKAFNPQGPLQNIFRHGDEHLILVNGVDLLESKFGIPHQSITFEGLTDWPNGEIAVTIGGRFHDQYLWLPQGFLTEVAEGTANLLNNMIWE